MLRKILAFLRAWRESFPRVCSCCGYWMESEDDMLWWHGYGNCVPITRAMWYDWTGDDTIPYKRPSRLHIYR